MASTAPRINHEAVRGLVSELCELLDNEDFPAFLAHCHGDFQYEIHAFSPELRRNMVWFCQSKSDMTGLMGMLPEQVRLPIRILRHVSTPRIVRVPRSGHIQARSTFTALRTTETGETTVLACGRYQDEFVPQKAGLLLLARTTILDTRDLGQGLHVPL